jgi:uncharacterized membrane protein YgcG
MRETLTRRFSLFDDSLEVDSIRTYSHLLGYLFGHPKLSTIARMGEICGLGQTSFGSSPYQGVYRYLPILWRIFFGSFLLYGWIHFTLLRPGINIVVQIPIYSIPLCAFFFGPSTVTWMKPHQVPSDVTKCSQEVLLEFGWLFTALPCTVTLFQLIGYLLFQHISGSYFFYGSQAASYLPNEAFFILYYTLFWLSGGALLGLVVAHCMIWMRVHEKQLKNFRTSLIENTKMGRVPLSGHTAASVVEGEVERGEAVRAMSRTPFDLSQDHSTMSILSPVMIHGAGAEGVGGGGVGGDSSRGGGGLRDEHENPFSSSPLSSPSPLSLQPESLMITHEAFRKSVIQSSQCLSYFTLSLFLFSTADYFFLLLVLRTQSSLLTVWTFIRVILWMILTLLVFTSAARVTQSWHQISVTIAAIRVLNTSAVLSSETPFFSSSRGGSGVSGSWAGGGNESSSPHRAEVLRRQWDELVNYFDHVRYSNGYNYHFGAIPITPSLIAKCCVGVVYASYLILYGLG